MEKKTLSQRLADRSDRPDASPRARNYAAFMSLKDEIAEALANGWRLKAIWSLLKEEGRIEFEYVAMWRYVRRYLHEADAQERKRNAGSAAAKQPK